MIPEGTSYEALKCAIATQWNAAHKKRGSEVAAFAIDKHVSVTNHLLALTSNRYIMAIVCFDFTTDL